LLPGHNIEEGFMSEKKRILCVIGTRPEAIKMAPVVLSLKDCAWADVQVLVTAQHREMLDQVMNVFGIKVDADLNVMRPNQTLPELTSRLMTELNSCLERMRPDIVIAQGDTTTVLVASLASFYRKIPFAHVEAGLRTYDKNYPFPEEMNRLLVGRLADVHFAPTETASLCLTREGVPEQDIHMTGNTVIDALMKVVKKDIPIGIELDSAKRMILVTAHRRENFGEALKNICRAILTLVNDYEDIEILYPVHPNPNVQEVVYRELGQHPRIRLCPPLDYGPFTSAMKRAYLILTDSGGVQEEAPALGKPVLVLRSETERPEAVEAGAVKLVGTDCEFIVREVEKLLHDQEAYQAMAIGVSPYGDGHAATRIATILHTRLIEADR